LVFGSISEIEELLNKSFSFSVWETREILNHEFMTGGPRRQKDKRSEQKVMKIQSTRQKDKSSEQ
jgi:hypothetical protein